ncbi:MAG: TonB-dependent receptor domain-containing protein, partial [Bryobacteraceae bacterium]
TGFLGVGRSREFDQLSRNVQLSDNLTWSRGRHTYKFGADVKLLRLTDNVSFFSGDDLGQYNFEPRYTGNAFGDFLLGIPIRTRVANTSADIIGVTSHYAFFVQDDWKVTPKLTLNYGLRYEVHPPFWDKTLQLANFDRDFAGGRVVVPNEESVRITAPQFRQSIGSTPIVTAAEAGIPRTLRFTDKNNFMPRLGFAWRPWDNRTVIRGGYGIYSVTVLGAVFYSLVGIHTSDTRTFDNAIASGRPLLQFPNPFGAGLGTIGAVGTADFRRGNEFHGPDPYAQQWNLTIERDLGWNTGLRVTYQGSHSIKLFMSPDLNQVKPNTAGYGVARNSRPYPNWAIVYSRDTGTSAKYNALITEVNRRFSNGFGMQSSWAWSKNLTNATGSNSTGFAAENGSVPTDRFNLELDYGNSSPTRRHRWTSIFNYQLPYGRTDRGSTAGERVLKGVLGGWELSGIFLFQTGPFLTPITSGTDPSGTNLSSRASNRPDYTGTALGNRPESERTLRRWFDPAAFVRVPDGAGRFGNAGPGRLVGPGTRIVSAKLAKKFYITEKTDLQLESTFINLPNHPNYREPALNASAPNFGDITSTQGAEGAGSRVLQVGMRFTF